MHLLFLNLCLLLKFYLDKPTYGENCHKFIKRAQTALRERLQEAEEIKGLRVDASVRKLPKYPFNADEKRKLSMCITRLKREQEKQVKDIRKQMETNNSISQSEIVNTSRTKEKEANSVTIPAVSTITTTTTSQPPAGEDTEKEDNDIDFSSESVLELLKEAAPELIKPNICKVTSEDNATADDSDRLVVVSDSQETGEETDKLVQNSPDNDRSESLIHQKFNESCNIQVVRSNSEETSDVVKMRTSDEKGNLRRKDVNKKTRDNEEIPFIGSSDVQSSGASLIVDTGRLCSCSPSPTICFDSHYSNLLILTSWSFCIRQYLIFDCLFLCFKELYCIIYMYVFGGKAFMNIFEIN